MPPPPPYTTPGYENVISQVFLFLKSNECFSYSDLKLAQMTKAQCQDTFTSHMQSFCIIVGSNHIPLQNMA